MTADSAAGSSGGAPINDGGIGGFQGFLGVTDANSDHNASSFIAEQAMGRQGTVRLVKIIAVHSGGGNVAQGGTVDVQPLTKQSDGTGQTLSHGTVYGLIYYRLQAGGFAIIADPVVGDEGLALVCDRDISANKSNPGNEAQPGSYRRFDLADGIYLGGTLNAKPTSYLRVEPNGSITVSPQDNSQPAPALKMDMIENPPILYLGGDPAYVAKAKFSPVQTVAGPSINVKARWQI